MCESEALWKCSYCQAHSPAFQVCPHPPHECARGPASGVGIHVRWGNAHKMLTMVSGTQSVCAIKVNYHHDGLGFWEQG